MSAPARSRSVRSNRHRAGIAALSLLLLTTAPALAADEQQPNSATIQWAQQILDQQGFYQGRASGKLDSATAAAIAAYQRKNGLKSTGRLDPSTVDLMLKAQPERKGVGNLLDPSSRAKASQPMNLREADVKPKAAPAAAAVARGEGSESTILGVSRGGAELPVAPSAPAMRNALTPAPTPAAPAASPAPAPHGGPAAGHTASPADIAGTTAAPRSSVETEVTPEMAAQQESGFDPSNFSAPDWVRYGLMGGIGALVIGMLGFWWGSGRRSGKQAARRPAAPPPTPTRREPTLGGTAPRADGRREPVFTAPARHPQRRV